MGVVVANMDWDGEYGIVLEVSRFGNGAILYRSPTMMHSGKQGVKN